MKRSLLYFLLSGFLICLNISAHGQNKEKKPPCMSPEELKLLDLPDVKIMDVSVEKENTTFHKVLGIIGKEINFELLLPEEWNERFVMGGGGGFVGSIQNVARSEVNNGFATVGTDTGHKGNGVKADWALNNMERQLNFGHLAVHRTAVVAKAIIEKFYCSPPLYSYFMGCSRGGGQALIEAQRYPEDFDGIVSAAPIIDWPATGAEFVQNSIAIYPDPNKLDEAIVSANHIKLLQKEVLAQCDELDGVKDDIINDPRECAFNFSLLPVCVGDKADSSCFTWDQIAAVKQIYAGVDIQGNKIYPGFPFGGEFEEGSWMPWIVGPDKGLMALNFPTLHYGFGTEMFKYLIFNDPDWDYSIYDFSGFEKDTKYAAAYLNATSTDYSGFKKRNGKMIIWHGWNDPALSAFTAINHFKEAKKGDDELEDYIRLFLLPGVLHCGGGSGPDQANWLQIIREWVENDKAPERIVVSKMKNNKESMSRPVFPYPEKAVYKGSGDKNKESSFIGNTN